MKIPFLVYVCLIFQIWSVACSERSIQNPDAAIVRLQSGFSETRDEVSRLAEPLIRSHKNVGMVIGIIDHQQKQSFYAYGLSDQENKTAMITDNVFAIGSVTKSLLISLLRILDEKNIVKLDDQVGEFFPENFKFSDDKVKQISLYQLASHTSGLPREPLTLMSLGRFINYLFTGENLYSHLTKETVYSFLKEVELSEPDRDNHSYSNIGIGLLGHLITLKTGKKLEDLLRIHLLVPLGMKLTTLVPNGEYKKRLATGYSGDQPYFISRNTPLDNWQFSTMMIGTGGAYSTAHDLLNLLKAYLSISNTDLDYVLGHRGDKPPLGWDHSLINEHQVQIFYFHGMIAGFNCYMGIEPESRSAVVVMQNNFNWVDKVGQNLLLLFAKRARMLKKDSKL